MNPSLKTPKLTLLVVIALLSATAFAVFAQTTDPVLSFPSLAALRAHNTSAFGATVPQALTCGYYTSEDGGGNQFVWSATFTMADNGGSVIKPTAVPSPSPGRWLAAKKKIFDVKTYGAKGDGIADDQPFFAAAIADLPANGGTIFVPPGTYFFATPWIIDGTQRVMDIQGAGRTASVLFGNQSLASIIQLGVPGSPPQYTGKISDLTVTRAAETPGGGTIGISAEHINRVVLEDVNISNHAIGLKTNQSWANKSLSLKIQRTTFHDCSTYLWLKAVAEVMMSDSNFGTNGETLSNDACIKFEGETDDVRIRTTQFLPFGGGPRVAFHWVTGSSTGYYRLDDINLENVQTAFKSDAACGLITDLSVINSRLTPIGKLFDFHANTALVNLTFADNGSIAFGTSSVISGAQWSRFTGNFINGGLEFNGGQWVVSGNTFTTTSTYSGTFSALVLTNNALVFNSSARIDLNVTGTGNIINAGNTVDCSPNCGSQPASSFPSDLRITSGYDFGLDASAGKTLTIANTGFGQPFGNGNNFSGLALIHNSASKTTAMFLVGAGWALVSQTGSDFGTGAFVPGKSGVYVNGNGALEINNNTGTSVTYRVVGLRLNSSQ
jgi:hypothetical protein